MEHDRLGRCATAWGLAAGVSFVFSAILVPVKELNENTVLAWMKTVTIHHWMTHAFITLAVFIVLGVVFSRLGGKEGFRMTGGALAGLVAALYVASGVLIAGFYLLEG